LIPKVKTLARISDKESAESLLTGLEQECEAGILDEVFGRMMT
jgi:hypothetical protein